MKWVHQNLPNGAATAGSVEVWQAGLALDSDQLAACERLLDQRERERASAFHFARDRDRFIAARGQLRLLLGRFLDEDPGGLSFADGPWGKPYLAGNDTAASPRFNVSHSADLGLVAISESLEMGVDLECLESRADPMEFCEAFLSPAERASLESIPSRERRNHLYSLWTAKEAFLKALGTGLHIDPRSFEVELPEVKGNAIHFHSLEFSALSQTGLVGFSIDCGDRFSATVVVPGGRVIQRGLVTMDKRGSSDLSG